MQRKLGEIGEIDFYIVMLAIPYFVKKSSIHAKGIFSAGPIKRGKIIYEVEKDELEKISIQELKKWPRTKQELFLRFSFQGGSNFYYVGIADYETQKPIDESFYMNHSCDPNCWHVGEKIAARKNICKNEELTIDYGTIMSPKGLEDDFKCECQSTNCRGFITKKDCLNPDIITKYRNHFAPFIFGIQPLYR